MKRHTERSDNNNNYRSRGFGMRLTDSRGMTMAEVLIAVGIVIVLAGVAFIALFTHQRNLAQLECDNMAKEIFIAAQNHLTPARGEGYPGLAVQNDDGKYVFGDEGFGTAEADADNYYLVVNTFSTPGKTGDAILNMMLPFGSIEENVRGGGSYIIRYNRSDGKIIEVFYCTTTGRFAHELTVPDYQELYAMLMPGAEDKVRDTDTVDNRENRRKWKGDVLGWYGGADLNEEPLQISEPEIQVKNQERLSVTVSDVKAKDKTGATKECCIRLLINGVSSGAQRVFFLKRSDDGVTGTANPDADPVISFNNGKYTVVLDDITYKDAEKPQSRHFGYLFNNMNTTDTTIYGKITTDKNFMPGEDLMITAVAYSKNHIANVAYSNEVKTNSLFASVDRTGNVSGIDADTAYISNIRHLENLENTVSNGGYIVGSTSSKVAITKAVQTDNLDWDGFASAIAPESKSVRIYKVLALTEARTENSFVPIVMSDAAQAVYDGNGHSITGIPVINEEKAGLFGTVTGGNIRNLELVDFEIAGTVSAGALAGEISGTTINNVLAVNKDEDLIRGTDGQPKTTITSSGSAGGLIGKAANKPGDDTALNNITYSAAALTVYGGSSAGGFIGEAINTNILQCYSAGYTNDGEFYVHEKQGDNYKVERAQEDSKDIPIYNVTGAVAGGLVGSSDNTKITNSYSTCSVKGTNSNSLAGGLVGTANDEIVNCYSAGMIGTNIIPYNATDVLSVNGAKGAFAGSATKGDLINCRYLEIVTEVMSEDKSGNLRLDHYLAAVGDTDVEGEGNSIALPPIDTDTEMYQDFVGSESTWDKAKPYDSSLKAFYNDKYLYRTVDELAGNTLSDEHKYFVSVHYGDWPAPELFIINN